MEKGQNDFVTEVDQAAEKEIRYHLKKAYPDHAIIGEEGGLEGNENAEYQWIIDPLDGTTNFIRGIPHYAVSIACLYKGKIEHAVVLDPVRREEFTASRGHGTGIPYKNRSEQHIPAYTQSLQDVCSQTAGIRRAGSAALDLAYVAAGRLDGFWEIGLNQWDTAAGLLLVREAGGLVADFKGGSDYMKSGNIVTGGPKCFKALLQTIQPRLGHIG
jgi:myo-inositol-1(or 4)-monophosphatase